MNILIYFIVSCISLYFWYQRKYGERNKLLDQFPAPKSYPILRHSVHVVGKSPSEVFQIMLGFNKKYGPVWRFDLNPFVSSINVLDPKIVEEILTSQKLIDKGKEYDMMKRWLGSGLIMSSGKTWHQRRKIITPAFHFKILEQFTDIMEKHGVIFIEKLKNLKGKKVDIYSIVSLFALDVICESAMGYELNAQLDDTSEYVKAVKEMAHIIFQRVFDSKKHFELFYKITSLYRHEKIVVKKMHDFTLSVIDSRRKYWEEHETKEKSKELVDDFGLKKKTALLDLLLKTKIDGKPLDDMSIREEVDNFMFAGHDTTSTAVSFTLLNIAKNPEIQQRIYEECREVFEDDFNRLASMQDLNKMSYLEKVIKEGLRLYPPVPVYSRRFREDVKIGDYIFPANVTTKINFAGMSKDPKLFPDPLKFDPSRFDDENNIKLFSYVPFSAGPRNCIGQKYGMLEIKSIITKIIKRFIVSVEKEDENPEYALEVVLRPVNGINLSFKQRTNF